MDLWLVNVCGVSLFGAVVALIVARRLRLHARIAVLAGGAAIDPASIIGELSRCAAVARTDGPGALHTRTPGVRHPLLSRGSHLVARMVEPGAIRRELDGMVNGLMQKSARRAAAARWVALIGPGAALAALTFAAACWLRTLDDPTTAAGGFALAALVLYGVGAVLGTLAHVGAAAAPIPAAFSLTCSLVIEGMVAIREGADEAAVEARLRRIFPGPGDAVPARKAA